MKKQAKIPFPFIIENLLKLEPYIKPMFGCHALYCEDKILLILRQRPDHPESNGVWIATSKEHHDSLRNDVKSLCSIEMLNNGKGETGWQMIPLDSDDFESQVSIICDLILKGDIRIGRIPKARKKKVIK